jgi:dipeptidyl aminopeptidase/acylaminoacyl peptidase
MQGLVVRARLVMLPHESHGYAARESVLHVMAEMAGWLDQHLRPADGQPAEADARR